MLTNIEAYDNKTVLFIYLGDLLFAYEHHSEQIGQEAKAEVEKFVLRIVTEMIYKGSGAIFKQLMSLMSRMKQKKALTFLVNFLYSLMKNREKVSRVCQLLFTLCEDSYKTYN